MTGMRSLHLEIIGSQLGIVNVQDLFGIELGGNANLQTEQKEQKFKGDSTFKASERNQTNGLSLPAGNS